MKRWKWVAFFLSIKLLTTSCSVIILVLLFLFTFLIALIVRWYRKMVFWFGELLAKRETPKIEAGYRKCGCGAHANNVQSKGEKTKNCFKKYRLGECILKDNEIIHNATPVKRGHLENYCRIYWSVLWVCVFVGFQWHIRKWKTPPPSATCTGIWGDSGTCPFVSASLVVFANPFCIVCFIFVFVIDFQRSLLLVNEGTQAKATISVIPVHWHTPQQFNPSYKKNSSFFQENGKACRSLLLNRINSCQNKICWKEGMLKEVR